MTLPAPAPVETDADADAEHESDAGVESTDLVACAPSSAMQPAHAVTDGTRLSLSIPVNVRFLRRATMCLPCSFLSEFGSAGTFA